MGRKSGSQRPRLGSSRHEEGLLTPASQGQAAGQQVSEAGCCLNEAKNLQWLVGMGHSCFSSGSAESREAAVRRTPGGPAHGPSADTSDPAPG